MTLRESTWRASPPAHCTRWDPPGVEQEVVEVGVAPRVREDVRRRVVPGGDRRRKSAEAASDTYPGAADPVEAVPMTRTPARAATTLSLVMISPVRSQRYRPSRVQLFTKSCYWQTDTVSAGETGVGAPAVQCLVEKLTAMGHRRKFGKS